MRSRSRPYARPFPMPASCSRRARRLSQFPNRPVSAWRHLLTRRKHCVRFRVIAGRAQNLVSHHLRTPQARGTRTSTTQGKRLL